MADQAMTASILVCEYIKHGMTCRYGSDVIWTLLGIVFVIWLVGCLVCWEIKTEMRRR
jgi:hypothetical protein